MSKIKYIFNAFIRSKDGKLLENSENLLIECKNKTTHVLSFKSISRNDSGEYKIQAKNEIGVKFCLVNILVDGKYFT